MGTLKAEGDALRLGLIVGRVDRQDVVAWADQVIRSDRTAEAPVLLDLAVGVQEPIADIVSLLNQVPGQIDRAAVGRHLARQLREAPAAEALAGELKALGGRNRSLPRS